MGRTVGAAEWGSPRIRGDVARGRGGRVCFLVRHLGLLDAGGLKTGGMAGGYLPDSPVGKAVVGIRSTWGRRDEGGERKGRSGAGEKGEEGRSQREKRQRRWPGSIRLRSRLISVLVTLTRP